MSRARHRMCAGGAAPGGRAADAARREHGA